MAEVVTHPQPEVAGLGLLTADDPSLLLVAELLREEIQAQTDARLAQRLQISFTTNRTTATGTGETDFDTLDDSNDEEEEEESDQLVSLRQQLDMINSTLSRSAIVGIAGSESAIMADSIRARQLSQQFEANTRKETMDHELAMVLQKEANEKKRERTGELDMEELLGKEKVQKLMVSSRLSPPRYVSSSWFPQTPVSTFTESSEATGDDAAIVEGKGKGKVSFSQALFIRSVSQPLPLMDRAKLELKKTTSSSLKKLNRRFLRSPTFRLVKSVSTLVDQSQIRSTSRVVQVLRTSSSLACISGKDSTSIWPVSIA